MRVPPLNFEGGPEILLLNFEGRPGVPLLRFRGEGGGESRIPMAWSHYYTMPNVCKHTFHISHVCISQNVKGVIM